ncbi:hypothetical protein ACQUSR_06900 [Streptomyces sp. P1-3]|uniref:hypothetical protein n=1 Tax=Streptomyces sp. P1-3 TaxID=3421658 RepID=UPI003D35EF1D
MRIEWPGFRLQAREGILEFQWTAFGVLEVQAARCCSLKVRPDGQSGGLQLFFDFRTADGRPGGLIVARADVPAEYARAAAEFVRELQHRYGISDAPDDDGAEDELPRRVPYESQEWISSPVAAPAEELYAELFGRISAERAS